MMYNIAHLPALAWPKQSHASPLSPPLATHRDLVLSSASARRACVVWARVTPAVHSQFRNLSCTQLISVNYRPALKMRACAVCSKLACMSALAQRGKHLDSIALFHLMNTNMMEAL
ncbi:hypothetical protein K437DRAFT_3831 [Tilletiaria anomala UBC 951]|uniref:Uncharacterized protein n=1 Tax=Tilletiaria anomala (strain ATCC 24038 / CBS 436.72 / UBC 951) TaxID=1037660 RepID=A0A066WIF7_TILAU|nr:uncharacterized protein K437DRAFT_3831 [Tilletiaria anomala UBC 951]KDN53626.1 hypothetical protein K437DRAFT_3831 [Tilletiaria anomala UBC 951]